jgi:hypothetical protein
VRWLRFPGCGNGFVKGRLARHVAEILAFPPVGAGREDCRTGSPSRAPSGHVSAAQV